MALTNPNTIHLMGGFTRLEEVASETIKPGHILKTIDSSGTKFAKHATAKGFAERLYAVEDALQGKTIDDSYSSGDLVSANAAEPGAEAFIYMKAGVAYVAGDLLQSAGDGTLQKNSGTSDLECLAVVVDAKDLSASGAVSLRTRVRFK